MRKILITIVAALGLMLGAPLAAHADHGEFEVDVTCEQVLDAVLHAVAEGDTDDEVLAIFLAELDFLFNYSGNHPLSDDEVLAILDECFGIEDFEEVVEEIETPAPVPTAVPAGTETLPGTGAGAVLLAVLLAVLGASALAGGGGLLALRRRL